MKYIIKLVFLALLFASAVSCDSNELDKEPVVSANGFKVVKDASITAPSVISDVMNNNVFGKYNWDVADNGISSVSTYQLVIFDHDNDPLLEKGVVYSGNGVQVTTESRNASLTVKEFNDMVNLLSTFKCGQMNIDVRIKSVLGLESTNGYIQYSNPITYAVTPYSTKLLELSFAKDASSAKTADKILSSSYSVNTDYEGYMYLQPGDYKFYQPDACRDYTTATVYGGTSGTLSNTAPSITIVNAGYYFIKANLTANTYSVSQYNYFGLYGTARSTTLVNNALPFTDDDNDNVWTLTAELFKGRTFKLKSMYWTAALAGTPPIVPSSAPVISAIGKSTVAGQLISVDPSLSVTSGLLTVPGINDGTKVTCVITIDVRNSRDYKYTLVTQ